MRKWAFLWSLGLIVLIAGAWMVCPVGRCRVGAMDRAGLGLAHAWRSEPLDALMQGITWLSMPADWSYPSAHAMQVTALAIALFLVAAQRRAVWSGLLGMIVLWVGLSRIYLQVHFPSDVIAGTLAAIGWVGGLHLLIIRSVRGHSSSRAGSHMAGSHMA
ncbi:MAG: phosphatase PAP2 family protein [Sulfuriferula multivorans]|uniref:Phosphatase PAP2 family protein n=1 Tax=Sulfuriferula multivorans TaxID=1559896 RepID=A0A7C9TAM9_9PROT|nr:phosphatase PAP2 family protein [Sulfuriferula multivorans]